MHQASEGHRGKNYWVIPQYTRNVRVVNGEQKSDYTCLHCQKTLSGLNQHRLKQHLLNPSVCTFNLSAAAEACPAPEVQQMVLAMRYHSAYVNQPVPLPAPMNTVQLHPQQQEQQVHQMLQPSHQMLQPQQHQQLVLQPPYQTLQPQQHQQQQQQQVLPPYQQQQQQQQQQAESQPQQPTPEGRSKQRLMSQYADSVSASEKAELDVLFAKMMVEASIPLTALDSPAFQALFKRLRPAYKLPSKQEIEDINEDMLDGGHIQRAGPGGGNQQEGMGEELEEEDLDD